MHNILKTATLLVTVATIIFSAQSAHAALVSYTITGDVILGGDNNGPNAFGLNSSDTITASGIFDDSVLTSGSGTIDFSTGSGNTMTISVGTGAFFASDDIGYGGGTGPSITLSSNSLTDFDFLASGSFNSSFTAFDDFGNLYGEWRTSIALQPVPIPGAAWLFGSGLLGLAGIARRKRSLG